LWIVNPDEVDGLRAVETQLGRFEAGDWRRELHMEDVDLTLPRIDVTTTVDLEVPLRRLGLASVFDGRPLCRVAEGGTCFGLSRLVHAASIRVEPDEDDVATTRPRKAEAVPLRRIAVDRPFALLVTGSGLVLFAGHVADPS
jgi:serine protease inhibitor